MQIGAAQWTCSVASHRAVGIRNACFELYSRP